MKNCFFTLAVIQCLVGCSKGNDFEAKATQVVAKVNGDEITVHQVNSEMQRMQVPVVNPQKVAKKILGSLIDRQLLVQEAVKLNLDRSPEVVQMVNTAKAQIYAQAYLARKVSALSATSEREVNQFVEEHPEVFSRRKVFTTSDIIFVNDPKKINYQQLQSSVTNIDELKAWLNNHEIIYEMTEENLPTESLPRETLSLADNIKVNDLLFTHDDLKIVARFVTNIAEVPLQKQRAQAMAIKALDERKRQQLILDEISRLKKMAKVEILDPQLASESNSQSVMPVSHSTPISAGVRALHNGL